VSGVIAMQVKAYIWGDRVTATEDFNLNLIKDCSAATVTAASTTFTPVEYILNTEAPANEFTMTTFTISDTYCGLLWELQVQQTDSSWVVSPKWSAKTGSDIFVQDNDISSGVLSSDF
jgi:hypothetical protein